jgi:hypothetical protein
MINGQVANIIKLLTALINNRLECLLHPSLIFIERLGTVTIHSTSLSSQLMNGPNKQESFFSLV